MAVCKVLQLCPNHGNIKSKEIYCHAKNTIFAYAKDLSKLKSNIYSDQKTYKNIACFLDNDSSKFKSKVRTHQDGRNTVFFALTAIDQNLKVT